LHSDREKAADAVLTAMCMVALVAGSRPSRAGESFTLNFPTRHGRFLALDGGIIDRGPHEGFMDLAGVASPALQ